MAIFGELIFIFAADYIQWGKSTLHIYFVVSYIVMAVLQVSITPVIVALKKWKVRISGNFCFAGHVVALRGAYYYSRYVAIQDRPG